MIRLIEDRDIEDLVVMSDELFGRLYLTREALQRCLEQSQLGELANGWCAFGPEGTLEGFVIIFAPGMWDLDEYMTPSLWPGPTQEASYAKVVAVRADRQRRGIGLRLLAQALNRARAQSAKFAVSHVWAQSPNDGARRLIQRVGGKEIRRHSHKWYEASMQEDWACVRCGRPCYCDAIETTIDLSVRMAPMSELW